MTKRKIKKLLCRAIFKELDRLKGTEWFDSYKGKDKQRALICMEEMLDEFARRGAP